MGLGQWMWVVWAVFVAITIAIYLYRGRLTRDEEDEIYLGDGFEQEKATQADIAAKVARVEPLLRVFLWATAVVTVVVVAYWAYDMLLSLHLIG